MVSLQTMLWGGGVPMQAVRGIIAFMLVALTIPVGTGCASPGAAVPNGDWVGAFKLPASASPVTIDLQLRSGTALVALGPGHAALQGVPVRRRGADLSFSLPGLPDRVAFSLQL